MGRYSGSFLVIVSVCFASCVKENSSKGCGGHGPIEYSPGASPDLPDIYSANFFEIGSYWVYEDMVNSLSDTVFVDNIRHVEGNYGACFAFPDEHHIRLSGLDRYYYWSFSGVQVFFDTVETPYTRLEHGTIYPTSYPEDFDVLDSLVLDGIAYYNVYKHGPRSIVIDGVESAEEYYYFVEGIGLIRKERYQNGMPFSDMELREYIVVL